MRLATEVAETENLFEILTNKSPVGLCIIQDGGFCYTNPTFQSITGYKEDELLGKDALELVVPEDREQVRENAIKMLKEERTLPYQFRVTHKNGSIKWVIESVASVQYRGRRATLGDFIDITGRKQVEDALKAEKNKLQSLIDAMEETITIQDTEYNIIYQNEPSRIASGGDHLGEKCYRVYEGRESICEGCPVEKAFKDGKSHTTERRTTIAGKVAFWENTANPIRDAEGRIVSCLELARDITERKKQEQALADELTQRRLLVDKSLDGIVVLDVDAKVVEANQRFAEMLGYTLEEVRELHTWDWDKNYSRKKILEMGRNVDEKGLHLETKHTRKDGSVIDVDISISGIMCEGQKLIFCIDRDITERKKAEQALADELTRRRLLVDQSLDGIVVINENDKVYEANQRFAEMLGYTLEEVHELHTWDWDKNYSHKKIHELGRKADEKGFLLETTHTRKDGSVIDVDISINASMFGGQKLIFCVCRDVTERKQAERKVQHLNLVLRAIRNINQLIARGTDRDGLLKGTCDTFVETRGYYSAWIALLDESGKLVTAAEAGLGKSFLQVMERLKRGKLTHCGCKVLEKPGVLVMKDVSSECADCPVAKKEDTGRGAMSVRLEYDGKVYGLMTVSIPPDRAVEKEEHDMLEEIAGDIAFALHSMEQKQERKRAEEALRDSEEKLWKIFESATDGISVIDLKGIITEVNQRMVEMHGFSSKDELRGKNALELLAPRDHKKIAANMKKVIKQGAIRGVEYTLLRADGSEFPGELSTNALKDASGNPVGHITIVRDITERKRAEEALQAEKNKLQSVIDAMADALTIQDRDYNIIFQNEPSRKSTGGARVGEKCYRVYEGRDKLCEGCPVEKAFKDGKPHISERQRVLPSGELSFWENTANPIRDAAGRFVSCLEIGRDITERKRQEQALADELTRRRLLVDQSLDGIVVLDVDAKVVEANQSFAEMLGYTLEEARELHTWDWDKNFPPEKIAEMGRNVDEKGLHLETKHTRKDGSVIDVDISINGTMCGGQKLIFCVCRDITERKKMEEALKLAAEEWRGTFDSITDAISIHDRDFRIQRANKAFADIFNMRPDQIIGRHCYELHKGGEPISGCPHKQTLATGKPASAEFYESNLGKYLLESTSPIFDEKGEVVGTIHVTRDITEQKQQNERLMMADRLASIGELAAGTAHELNNPLTSVIGFTQLVMERDIPDDIREDLKLIHSEAQRAAGVTKNLLTFARKQAPVKQLNQINNIIEDVLKLRDYEHKVNSIEVQRQLALDLPEIKVDYFQMQQVLLNIIINAEYFMIEAHSRGTLTITTKKRNGSVRISIADDGPGIPPENLSRIFNPFFTTKAAGKGTGLGLSICHGIVAEHGGQMYAKSQPGKGTTIVIELPVNNGH